MGVSVRTLLAALVTIVAAGGCACDEVADDQSSKPSPPVTVEVLSARDVVAGAVEAGGVVALRRESQLGFTSGGRIANVEVNEGDPVRSGQLLAALDATTVSSEVAAALAERNRASAELRRSEELLQQRWVTRARVESARAAYLAAAARVRAASFMEGSASIRAPGRGVILARLAEPGQVVMAGAPVLLFGEAASGMVLRAAVTDRQAGRIRRGAAASVLVEAASGKPINGTVIEVGALADRTSGMTTVEVALAPLASLRSGQIGSARISTTGDGADVIRIPLRAVLFARGDEGFVYVVDRASRRVRLTPVRLGAVDDGGVRITEGVGRDAWVVVTGGERLSDGVLVRPVPSPD